MPLPPATRGDKKGKGRGFSLPKNNIGGSTPNITLFVSAVLRGMKIASTSIVNLNEDNANNIKINVFRKAEGHIRFEYHNG